MEDALLTQVSSERRTPHWNSVRQDKPGDSLLAYGHTQTSERRGLTPPTLFPVRSLTFTGKHVPEAKTRRIRSTGPVSFPGHEDYNDSGIQVLREVQQRMGSEIQPDLSSLNLPFVEQLLADYARDPASVPAHWREYFDRLRREGQLAEGGRIGPSFRARSIFNPVNGDGARLAGPTRAVPPGTLDVVSLQDRVDQLIRAYRVRGHVVAKTDPLGGPRPYQPELDPGFYGFTEADMDRPFSTRTIYGPDVSTLREILERMQRAYCGSIGVQYMHIDQIGVRHWLQDRIEGESRYRLTRDEQIRVLTRLTDAVIFEEFIQKKFVGAKRFSLEGAESLIPLLDLAIEKAGADGIREIVLGMAHRGRLNVLANIMGKGPQEIFREFEDRYPQMNVGRGDVKYHLGYSSDWVTAQGRKVHLSLCFNPSHLEFVNPVVQGRMRAKQDRYCDKERHRGMALLIHGDAAFAGEGIVQETLNLSELEGYSTGGTIHVIVNNQIGFTTLPSEGRSSLHASAVAKMLQIPIFHVNGEDPEAVAQVIRLAMDFRRDFHRDVVIEMYCFRRYGHNETDEPAFTQPVLYRRLAQRQSVRDSYLEHLLELGEVTREEADRISEQRRARLEEALNQAKTEVYHPVCPLHTGVWSGYFGGPARLEHDVETGVDRERLSQLLEATTRLPEGFRPHPTLVKWLAARREMARGERPLDWSAAEALGFATLAAQGYRVRVSGQDSARGTFSHRHAVLHDYEDGRTFMPLQHVAPGQAPIEIYNSPLSEAGVLGFEYGYSLDCPDGLVVWEAQFGDFVNVAQVIIDQFLASAEVKWQRLSGLVLLLPHGFEGQGPEHSSARLERFLMLAAEDNMQIINPTTPAQIFHALRRQVIRRWRKPLVVMTPKSLLRHPAATSSLNELATGTFRRIIPDDQTAERSPERVILCSGKIYYDLVQHRNAFGREDIPIIRVEQLYPLFDSELCSTLSRYPDHTPVYWVQEEPRNMGAWPHMRLRFGEKICGRWPLQGIARAESSSPATGSAASHKLEQQMILEQAFGETATGAGPNKSLR